MVKRSKRILLTLHGGLFLIKFSFKFLLSLLSLSAVLALSASAKDQELPAAFAPVEVVLEGLQDPAFLTIDADEVLYISEEQAGRVLQVFPDGRVQPLVEGLKKPQGLAVDGDGTLYIAAEELKEEKGKGKKPKGLVLKWTEGQLQIVASGLQKPTGLAVDGEGTVYVAAEGEEDEGGSVFRIDAQGVSLVATGFKHPQGLIVTPDGQLLVAAERLQGEGEERGGTIFQVNLEDGWITPLVDPGFQHPHSLVLDRLGALFFSAEEREKEGEEEEDEGLISKRLADGTLQTFATPLEKPKGLSFDHQGNLYAVEAERLLRFWAPPPPQVDPLPAFTNQNPLTVTGTAEPDALLTITGGAAPASAVTAGPFAIPVHLQPNQGNSLNVFGTGAQGFGLTGAPTLVTITHDELSPDTSILGEVLRRGQGHVHLHWRR